MMRTDASEIMDRLGVSKSKALQMSRSRRARMRKTQNRKCFYCHVAVYKPSWILANSPDDRRRMETMDHIIPVSVGSDGRVVIACAECNQTRGDTPFEVFVAFMKRPRTNEFLRQEYRNFCHSLMLNGLAKEGRVNPAPAPRTAYTLRELRKDRAA